MRWRVFVIWKPKWPRHIWLVSKSKHAPVLLRSLYGIGMNTALMTAAALIMYNRGCTKTAVERCMRPSRDENREWVHLRSMPGPVRVALDDVPILMRRIRSSRSFVLEHHHIAIIPAPPGAKPSTPNNWYVGTSAYHSNGNHVPCLSCCCRRFIAATTADNIKWAKILKNWMSVLVHYWRSCEKSSNILVFRAKKYKRLSFFWQKSNRSIDRNTELEWHRSPVPGIYQGCIKSKGIMSLPRMTKWPKRMLGQIGLSGRSN